MARSFAINRVSEKNDVLDYINQQKSLHLNTKIFKSNFIRKYKNCETISGKLFLRKKGKLLQVLVREEKDHNNEILKSLHLPGHFGKNFSTYG